MPKEEYGAKDLAVLEGLDAVRKRPGMYIGTTDSQGLMHCLWEIIDNSVDEALAGFCNDIVVTLHTDGSVEVADNGRGIPVDKEPKTGLSGVEVVLTKLHAGAKFGNSSYNAVGGLHGVGSSVVNALSSRLDVEVDRDGKTHHMTFHQGHPGVYTDADPANPSPDSPFKRTRKNRPTELEIIGKVSPKTTGTRIRYWYDPEIFNKTAEFSYEQLIDRVRQTSFLVPGLKITIIDENVPETAATDTVEATDDATVEPAQDQAPALDVSSNDAELFDDSAESQSDDAESPAEEDFTRASWNSCTQAASRTSSTSCPKASRSPTSGASKARAPIRRRPRPWVRAANCTPRKSNAPAAWTSPCDGSTAMTPQS
jgi:DNA gyrase subunit B